MATFPKASGLDCRLKKSEVGVLNSPNHIHNASSWEKNFYTEVCFCAWKKGPRIILEGTSASNIPVHGHPPPSQEGTQWGTEYLGEPGRIDPRKMQPHLWGHIARSGRAM